MTLDVNCLAKRSPGRNVIFRERFIQCGWISCTNWGHPKTATSTSTSASAWTTSLAVQIRVILSSPSDASFGGHFSLQKVLFVSKRFWNLLLVFVIKESMWVLLLSSENCVSVPSPCLSWKIHSKIPFLCHKRLFIGTAGAFVLVIVYGVWPIQPIHPKKQIFGCPNPLIGGESPAARRHAGWDIIPIFLCRSCWTA